MPKQQWNPLITKEVMQQFVYLANKVPELNILDRNEVYRHAAIRKFNELSTLIVEHPEAYIEILRRRKGYEGHFNL
jgi:hypothetical protein